MPCSLKALRFVSPIEVSVERFAVEDVLKGVTYLFFNCSKTLDLGNDLFLPASKSLQSLEVQQIIDTSRKKPSWKHNLQSCILYGPARRF